MGGPPGDPIHYMQASFSTACRSWRSGMLLSFFRGAHNFGSATLWRSCGWPLCGWKHCRFARVRPLGRKCTEKQVALGRRFAIGSRTRTVGSSPFLLPRGIHMH